MKPSSTTTLRPSEEEVEDLALRLEIDYREHRYQNCQRAASMLRRLVPSAELASSTETDNDIQPDAPGWELVESARKNARYWESAARNEPERESALMHLHQAMLAYKNCAYYLAGKLSSSTRCSTMTDLEISAIGASVPAGRDYEQRRDRAIADAAARKALQSSIERGEDDFIATMAAEYGPEAAEAVRAYVRSLPSAKGRETCVPGQPCPTCKQKVRW